MATKQEREDLQTLADSQAAGLAELNEADRKGRAPRTAGQAGLAAALFVAFDYIVRGHFNVDLDPAGPGDEMPVAVTVAFTSIFTYLVAVFMNRKRKIKAVLDHIDEQAFGS